jgi:hypothetical protein
MKPSEVLRKAAQMVERDYEYLGCLAIWHTARSCRLEAETLEFFERVAPARRVDGDPWWGNWATCEKNPQKNARIIGLCLAAALAESEGK